MRSRWSIVVAALLAMSACGGAEEEVPGQALYETNCGTCHGPQGLGDGPLVPTLPVAPPSLLDHLGHHPADELIQIIMTGLPPAMPPAPLTENEVRLVVDYAWTLVPDSLLEGLREMQRMAEMGMPMDSMMDDSMHMHHGMEMETDSGGAMPPMPGDTAGGAAPSG